MNVVEATEVCLGQWLARSPADEDGVWPTAFVREALENILPSETLAKAVVSERWRMVWHIVWLKTERLHAGLGNGIASWRDAWRRRIPFGDPNLETVSGVFYRTGGRGRGEGDFAVTGLSW